MPITAPQVLWVNMITSVALGLVISFEPHEIDVMQRPPRAVDRPIVTGFGVWRIIFVGLALLAYTLLAFFWMKVQGASDALARTVAVNAITIGQVFYLLNSRYLLDSSLSLKAHMGNAYLPLGIIAVVILQLIFTYAPPLQAMFGNESVPLWVWPWLLAGGLLFFFVVEAEKLVIRSSLLAEAGCRYGSWRLNGPAFARLRVVRSLAALCAATGKMRCGTPGVIGERLKAPYGIDASDGLVGGQPFTHHRAERRTAMAFPQFAECLRALFELGKGLLGRCSGSNAFLLRVERSLRPTFWLDWDGVSGR